MTYSSTVLITY